MKMSLSKAIIVIRLKSMNKGPKILPKKLTIVTGMPEATPFVHSNMSDEDKGKCLMDIMTYGRCCHRSDENGASRHVAISEVFLD